MRANWGDLYIFERVVHFGSLSETARAMEISQPTLSRQIKKLEREMGAKLLQRHIYGVTPTKQGEEVLILAREMRNSVQDFQAQQKEKSHELAGVVRITSSILMAAEVLPKMILKIRTLAPQIQIELVANDRQESLIFGDADIAIRFFPSQQQEVISVPLANLEIGCYASLDYLEKNGEPQELLDLQSHSLIGFDKRTDITDGLRQVGIPVTPNWFSIKTDSDVAYWGLVRNGAGIGFMQRIVGDKDKSVKRIMLADKAPSIPIWLAAPQSMRHLKHVKFAWDFLRREF